MKYLSLITRYDEFFLKRLLGFSLQRNLLNKTYFVRLRPICEWYFTSKTKLPNRQKIYVSGGGDTTCRQKQKKIKDKKNTI